MTKEQRAEISRQNGARSKGPTTTRGKANSSRNALKHGEYAQSFAPFLPPRAAVLCNEELADFQALATQMAEIFSTDIDFHKDLRKGDTFSVVYEMFYDRGEPVRSGRVLSAEFVNDGRSFRAVWYAGVDGKGSYYTPEGKSLRKAFLRSPLEFSRVTSSFGMRQHPILQSWRAHMGVDYGAPKGTRVRATADGVVDSVGMQGGYGNLVVVQHGGSYSTAYAHMSRISPGLRRGSRVSQGDVIGFVGTSGWSTGPHLHYEFRVNKDARDQYELRTHKRLLDIVEPTEKTVDALMKLDLAAGVEVPISLG